MDSGDKELKIIFYLCTFKHGILFYLMFFFIFIDIIKINLTKLALNLEVRRGKLSGNKSLANVNFNDGLFARTPPSTCQIQMEKVSLGFIYHFLVN